MFKLVFCSVALTASTVFAQDAAKITDFNKHGWYSYSGDHAVRGRWGIHFDSQWRRSEVVTRWQQYQLRPGVNFQYSPALLLTLGYAFTRAYPYGEFPVRTAFPEHRIYQQALIRTEARNLVVQQRIRMEQRFIRYPDPQPRSWTYQNRFRYMVKLDFPITRNRDDRVQWYVPLFNEVLIGIPPNYGARPFDQNRLFLGIGYSTAAANFEIGYMNQFIGQRNGRVFEFNNTLFVTVTSRASLARILSR
jgi:hypothetical protein